MWPFNRNKNSGYTKVSNMVDNPNLQKLHVNDVIGSGYGDKSGINGDVFTDYNGNQYKIAKDGTLRGMNYNVDNNEVASTNSFSDNSGINNDVPIDSSNSEGFFKKNAGTISAVASIGSGIIDDQLNKSYNGNQGAFVSGAFSLGNPMYDSANNINTAIASTNYNDLNSQYQNKLKQINQYKTDELSAGQIGGMATSGAMKGAAMGTQILPGWGTAIGAVVGAGAGLGKGLLTNNKIGDTNIVSQQKGLEANNYMNRGMMDIKSQQGKKAKQDVYNNAFYHTASNGGYLYAPGGELENERFNKASIKVGDYNSEGYEQKFGDVGYMYLQNYPEKKNFAFDAENKKYTYPQNSTRQDSVIFQNLLFNNGFDYGEGPATEYLNDMKENRDRLQEFKNRSLKNGGYLYANGGLMNPYGINVFNNGKLHSQNKYGGVPVSIAEDGKPNLVEEGEVLYDDYVYSNRIKINDTIRRRLKLKDSTKTFADAAKEVKERGDDRPNDPVTEKTIKAQMQFLKSEQDKKKEQQEEREQQKMMAQMNEQQLQAMQEQQMNEEADAYEQQMAEEQMAQQEQQMVNPQMQEQMMAQQQQPQQQMFANGGNLKGGSDDADAHRFVKGTRIKKGKEADIKSNRLKLLMDFYDQIENNEELTDDQKQQEIDKFIKSINNTQDSHKAISSGKDINNVSFDQAVKDFQSGFRYNDDLFSSDMFESLGNVDENSNHDRFASWTPDGYYSAVTKERNIGVGDNYFTEDELKQINDRFGKYGYTWSNTENNDDNDKYYRFTKKQGQPESPTEKTYNGGEDVIPNYNWRYKQTPVPGLIDSYLAARAFAPADYSRAESIINTPMRDIQYTPNGGKIAPYIIDPRLQYQMNADLGAATNRGLVNNAGGNSAAAQAALLANNRQISQSAANLGYQADAQNAEQIQAAQQFNNAVDAQNAQGFLSAAEANQRADVQRGEFNYYGQNMKENIDAQRGQAISNSLQSLSDDYMNYYKYRYNQGMMAGLVDSGYFGEPTPFLRQQAGWNPNGTFTRNNYLIDDNGNKHYIVNNADGTVAFANPNDDLISKNQGKKLVFNNGEYKFVG